MSWVIKLPKVCAPVLAVALALSLTGPTRAERPRVYALTGATVVQAPGEVLENAVVVLRDGLIESVGVDVEIPADAESIDASGRWIYPGLIDAHSDLGIAPSNASPSGRGGRDGEASATPTGPVHPLTLIRAERRARDRLRPFAGDALKSMEKIRDLGFTITLAVPEDGILAGESAAILLLDDRPVAEAILADGVAQHAAFQRASFGQGYPTSLMGSVAAFRQAMLDAQRFATWNGRYAADPTGLNRPPAHATFEALQPVLDGERPIVFTTTRTEDTLLADRLAREFELDAMISTSGADWEAADRIAASGRRLIVSVGFPEKPKVEEDDEALGVSIETMQRYLDAPAGPARLHEAGVTFALTMHGLKNTGDFYKHLRQMIEAGLPEDIALASLTTTPARLLGLERIAGTLSPGKIGNLLVADGPLFDEDSKIREVFVDGVRHEIDVKEKPQGDPDAVVDPRGEWSVRFDFGGRTLERAWTIEGDDGDYTGTAETRAGTVAFEDITLAGNVLTVRLPGPGGNPSTEITVIVDGETFEGSTELGSRSVTLTGSRTSGPDGDVR